MHLLLGLGIRFGHEGSVEGVQDRQQTLDDLLRSALMKPGLVPDGPLAVVVEVGCHPLQIVEIGRCIAARLLHLGDQEADRLLIVVGKLQPE